MNCTCGMSQAVCRLLQALMTEWGQTAIKAIRYSVKPNLSLGLWSVYLLDRWRKRVMRCPRSRFLLSMNASRILVVPFSGTTS